MSNSLKSLVALGLVVMVAACAQQEEEFVVVDPEPISEEPEFTGKLK
ncbi:MAG: hypothetical protein AAGA97_10575 [Pseudomonadota bacterium]